MTSNTDRQEQHKKNKKLFKIIGAVLICIALVLIAVGMISFFSAMKDGGYPEFFWMLMVGMPMLVIGVFFLSMGFRREMATYLKNESVPVFNEAGKEIAPAVRSIASAAREGNEETQVCSVCGAVNQKESKFCKSCGASLKKTCANCGAEIDSDSKFCDKCGAKIDHD